MRLLGELQRRNVFRVAAAYIVFAWLIIQVVETILPVFGFGESAIRLVIVVLGIGLLPVLVFAWVFELTPEGLKFDSDVDLSQSIATRTGKLLDRVIVSVLALALCYFAVDKFLLDPARDAERLESARLEGRREAIIASLGDRSIAVLPFADMSPKSDQSYFSEGVAEELLNLLASIREIRVTSRSSAFAFKDQGLSVPEIAERLNVVYVLDGSVRKAGDQLRISAQLIDARADRQLWSRQFDRELRNIFEVQDEIASDVVEQIRGTLNIAAPAQRETDPAAYAMFLQARQKRRLGTVEGYDQAVTLYLGALDIDPAYPPAWDELASTYQSQALTGLRPAEEGFQLAREAALAAINADPAYAPAYDSLAFLSQYHEADLEAAAGFAQQALTLAPNDAGIAGSAGMLLQNMGRIEEGLEAIEYAVLADPVSAGWHYTLGIAYLSARRYRDAIGSFEKVLELSPGFSLGHYQLGVALMLDGQLSRALAVMAREPRERWRLTGLALVQYALEHARPQADGASSPADATLAELVEKFPQNMTYNIAYVYAFRGDNDAAFDWLQRAVEEEDPGIGGILSEVLFRTIHDDPRWVPFLRKLGKDPDRLAAIALDFTPMPAPR